MAYLNRGSVFGEFSRTAKLAERLDSGLRRAATGLLGGSFPTPLYHGSAELAERPASMQASSPIRKQAAPSPI